MLSKIGTMGLLLLVLPAVTWAQNDLDTSTFDRSVRPPGRHVSICQWLVVKEHAHPGRQIQLWFVYQIGRRIAKTDPGND